MSADFKVCPYCSRAWPSREEFLSDGDISLVGYQVNFNELSLGLFLFNHSVCQTTLAIRAEMLKDLFLGPVFKGRRTGQRDCPGYCLKRTQLADCPTECECAWVRALLQVIRRWPKSAVDSRAAVRR